MVAVSIISAVVSVLSLVRMEYMHLRQNRQHAEVIDSHQELRTHIQTMARRAA